MADFSLRLLQNINIYFILNTVYQRIKFLLFLGCIAVTKFRRKPFYYAATFKSR